LTPPSKPRTLTSVITSDVKAKQQPDPIPPALPSTVRRSEQVTTLLLDAIFTGRWAPGARLPAEDELAAELGAGRSSIREAIKALEHGGVIRIRRGRGGGTYVAEPSYRQLSSVLSTLFLMRGFDVTALYNARRVIEPGIAALAAEQATAADLAELEAILDEVASRLQADLDVSELNARLHFVVARSTHNPLLLMLAAAVVDLMRQVDATGLVIREGRERVLTAHRALVQAIRERDSGRAQALMAQHIHDAEDAIAHATPVEPGPGGQQQDKAAMERPAGPLPSREAAVRRGHEDLALDELAARRIRPGPE
jgi:GntR family transcriptional regulator, transcriptional repressor for pyruvate dehydrogenase complex